MRTVFETAGGDSVVITLPRPWVLGSDVKRGDRLRLIANHVIVVIPASAPSAEVERIRKALEAPTTDDY